MAGMLATLLATPCSAPFVGSAVTVALTGDMAQLFAVFMAMGAGCAISGAGWVFAATGTLDGLVKTRFSGIVDRNDDLAWLAVANNSRRTGSVATAWLDRIRAFGSFIP